MALPAAEGVPLGLAVADNKHGGHRLRVPRLLWCPAVQWRRLLVLG